MEREKGTKKQIEYIQESKAPKQRSKMDIPWDEDGDTRARHSRRNSYNYDQSTKDNYKEDDDDDDDIASIDSSSVASKQQKQQQQGDYDEVLIQDSAATTPDDDITNDVPRSMVSVNLDEGEQKDDQEDDDRSDIDVSHHRCCDDDDEGNGEEVDERQNHATTPSSSSSAVRAGPETRNSSSRNMVSKEDMRQIELWKKMTVKTNGTTNGSTMTVMAKKKTMEEVATTTKNSLLSSISTFFVEFLDACLLFSCFRGVPISPADQSYHSYHHHLGSRRKCHVTVKVQATAVNSDCDDDNDDNDDTDRGDENDPDGFMNRNDERRRKPQKKSLNIESKLSESHFVGVVDDIEKTQYRRNNDCDDDSDDDSCKPNFRKQKNFVETRNGNARIGTPVTSLRKISTTTRITKIPASDLISISKYDNLDPGEVVAIIKTYLPAFGALYHGIDLKLRPQRFNGTFFEEKNLLISKGTDVDVEAITRLAILGGAHRVYILKSRKKKLSRSPLLDRLSSSRVIVLEGDTPEIHETILHQSMDVIIDLGCLDNIKLLKNSLSPTRGRLVCIERRKIRTSIGSRLKNIAGQATLMKIKGSCIYDYDDVCKNATSDVVQDLEYLLGLAQKRKLRPLVDKYIKARDVQVMKDDMKKRPPRGAVICEPWRGIPSASDSISLFRQEWNKTSFWIHNPSIRDEETGSVSTIDCGRGLSCVTNL